MIAHLQIFPDRPAAEAAIDKSRSTVDLVTMALDLGRFYVKMASPKPGVEPKYFCTDGRWRKYDQVIELPHSRAGRVARQ